MPPPLKTQSGSDYWNDLAATGWRIITMTTIQPLKNEQAVVQMVSKRTTLPQTSLLAPQSQTGVSKSDKSDKPDKSDKSDTATATNRLAALQSGKEASEIQVLAVRTSKAVEEQLESAQQQMNEITNSYPPFLRGSEQRQQYLMSISSIRKQIESMTIPPIRIDNAAASGDAKQMWASLFQNISVPELAANGPNEASDAQIREASSAVGTMLSDLSGRRAALEQQVAPTNPISSQMAQYMSQTAGKGLALAQPGLSLTNNFSGALKGM
jgi:hypothetical protein